jgi:dTDP-4-dehydrorhamnose reductase
MKILIIGANGQLGSDLVRAVQTNGDQLVSLTHREVDICETVGVGETLRRHRPEVVINTAAYHKVDECEVNVERSFAVNVYGVRNLALACKETGCKLLHMSTDYVFGADKARGKPYTETDVPGPTNVYGISKLAGEYLVRYILDHYWIVRSSGLYGVAGSSGKGGNFVELMLRLAREGRDIKVVDDQILTPTYTVDLACKIVELVHANHYGLYHITNAGQCTWYDFARKIFELANLHPHIEPTTTAAFGAVAARPSYSVLGHAALATLGMDDLPPWEEALEDYLQARKVKE